MTNKEVEILKSFWFEFHKHSPTCGQNDMHCSACLEVAQLLNRRGTCYRDLLIDHLKCDCPACKGKPASAQSGSSTWRDALGKRVRTTVTMPR